MNNTSEYQVTFSYDLNQTGQLKYDSFIRKVGEKFGAKQDQRYEDDYGAVDISFNSISDPTKLTAFVKEVLHDLAGKHVHVHASGQKYEYISKISQDTIKDIDGFNSAVIGWAGEKNVKTENNGVTLDLTFNNKKLQAEFLNDILPQTAVFTQKSQVPSVEDDWIATPAYSSNNYTEKAKPRI